MQFEVPQFIEIEDKIIGPLTWKQFVYMGGGVGILIILFLSIPSIIIFFMLGLPVAALSAALAFHKVNNRPFSYFLEAGVNYFTKSRLYLWQRETTQSVIDTSYKEAYVAPNLDIINQRSIASLTKKLELDNQSH